MRNVFVGSILHILARHGEEIPEGAVDDSYVPNHKAVVESEHNIALNYLLFDWKDSDLGDFHNGRWLGMKSSCLQGVIDLVTEPPLQRNDPPRGLSVFPAMFAY